MDIFKKVVSGVFLSGIGVSAVNASATGTGAEKAAESLVERTDARQSNLDNLAVLEDDTSDVTKKTLDSEASSFADDWRLAEQYYNEANGKILKLKDTLLATKFKSELDSERLKCSSSGDASSRVVYRQKAFEILAKVDRFLGLQEIDDAATERASKQERKKKAEELRAQKDEELRAQRDEIDNSIYKLQEKQLESKLNDDKYQIILGRIDILRERLLKVESTADVKSCWDDFYDISAKYDAFLREQYKQDEDRLMQEVATFQRDNANAIDELESRIDGFEAGAFVRRDKAKELVKKLRTLLSEVKNPFEMIAYNDEFLQCRERFEGLEKEDRDAKVEAKQRDLKREDFEMLFSDSARVARKIRDGEISIDFVVTGIPDVKEALTKYLTRYRRYAGLDKKFSGFAPNVTGVGFMLYGRGGLGKTWLAEMVAAANDFDYCFVDCGRWVGHSVDLKPFKDYLDRIIANAERSDKPLLINLDDVDRMVAPGSAFTQYLRSVLGAEERKGRKSRVRFCLTTNHKNIVENSLLRTGRIALSIEPRLLRADELEQLFRNYSSFFDVSGDVKFSELAERCRNFTPSFAKAVFLKALEAFSEELGDSADVGSVKLSQRHFDAGFEAASKEIETK